MALPECCKAIDVGIPKS